MNIQEAIRILTQASEHTLLTTRPQLHQAVQLGIAALQEKAAREEGEQP